MGESEKLFEQPSDPIKRLSKESSVPDEDSNIRLIPLTQGKAAIVDAEDYDRLNQWKWYAKMDGGIWYARRNLPRALGGATVLMHREILGPPSTSLVDHKNSDGLDNRKSNLRLATRQQNNCNKRKLKRNTSGYTGVHLHRQCNKWVASIRVHKARIYLGLYEKKEDAAAAYAEAAKKYFGEFARQ